MNVATTADKKLVASRVGDEHSECEVRRYPRALSKSFHKAAQGTG